MKTRPTTEPTVTGLQFFASPGSLPTFGIRVVRFLFHCSGKALVPSSALKNRVSARTASRPLIAPALMLSSPEAVPDFIL